MKKLCSASFGTSFAVDGRADNASGIAGTFAARVESFEADMAQCVRQTRDADRCRGAGLYADDCSFISQETMTLSPETAESFLQALSDERRHPEMEGRRDKTRRIAARREVVAEPPVDEVCHTLRRRSLTATALLPGETLEMLLEKKHL